MAATAHTITATGQTIRFHRGWLDECTDADCELPHASKAELDDWSDEARAHYFDQGVDAGKDER